MLKCIKTQNNRKQANGIENKQMEQKTSKMELNTRKWNTIQPNGMEDNKMQLKTTKKGIEYNKLE